MVNDCQLGVLPSVQYFLQRPEQQKTQLKFLFCFCLFQCLFVCFMCYCFISHVNSYTHGGTVSYLTTLFPGQDCVTFYIRIQPSGTQYLQCIDINFP